MEGKKREWEEKEGIMEGTSTREEKGHGKGREEKGSEGIRDGKGRKGRKWK